MPPIQVTADANFLTIDSVIVTFEEQTARRKRRSDETALAIIKGTFSKVMTVEEEVSSESVASILQSDVVSAVLSNTNEAISATKNEAFQESILTVRTSRSDVLPAPTPGL